MLAAQREVELRHGLLERLAEARSRTDKLFDIVRPDSLYERPIAERHRIVFYVGHLEAFDRNLLRDRLLESPALHPRFDRLFAFGIDPVGGGLPTDQPQDWPSLSDVRNYVTRTRRAVDDGLSAKLSDISSLVTQEFPAALLLQVAIEHRLMHAETLTYMLHRLPFERKVHPQPRLELVGRKMQPVLVDIPGGRATLGLKGDENGFGWDNEFEPHEVSVPSFAIDKYMITNAEFMEFVLAGGYEDRGSWTDADWNWKNEHHVTHPGFWRSRENAWYLRTMFDEIPLPPDWPVYVSHAEASAYARWSGKSLPTEAEWHRAAYGAPGGEERLYPWGSEDPSPRRGNFDFQRWDPTPVGFFPDGQSAFGIADLLGNGWEWTSTQFGPFTGFQPFPFYRGYSADFFDGRHFVMKGGSAQTAACMLRRSFRNWFQPHYPHVYAGFRCVSH
jgi:gamma-glutamyl hercynylcysteine S-oxide synthase